MIFGFGMFPLNRLSYAKCYTLTPIKKYRLEKGMTQKEMAKFLDIDPTTLSRIERGRGDRINKEIAKKLSNIIKHWCPIKIQYSSFKGLKFN